jgi:hypothetical protein
MAPEIDPKVNAQIGAIARGFLHIDRGLHVPEHIVAAAGPDARRAFERRISVRSEHRFDDFDPPKQERP